MKQFTNFQFFSAYAAGAVCNLVVCGEMIKWLIKKDIEFMDQHYPGKRVTTDDVCSFFSNFKKA